MIITFHIEYHTRDDERMHMVFADGTERAMWRDAENRWSAETSRDGGEIAYRYELRAADGSTLREEWGDGRLLDVGSAERVEIFDCWRERPAVTPFYSSFFTRGVFRRSDPRRAAEAAAEQIGRASCRERV